MIQALVPVDKRKVYFQEKISKKRQAYILGNNQVTCHVRTEDPLELGYCVLGFRDLGGKGLFSGTQKNPAKKNMSDTINRIIP